MNRIGVVSGCDVHKFQKTLFKRQLTEDFLGFSAVGAGGLDEHDHLPRLNLAVHKLLSHADRLSPEDRIVQLKVLVWGKTEA